MYSFLTVYIVHMGICLMSDLFFFFLHMLMNIKSISHCVFLPTFKAQNVFLLVGCFHPCELSIYL